MTVFEMVGGGPGAGALLLGLGFRVLLSVAGLGLSRVPGGNCSKDARWLLLRDCLWA